ncbi:hypothetical protein HG535_0D02990 [Zygotorulaspora mrakii]|uniref:RNA binding protein She2 domain-containing protein n=1 Tax=Zygotorulaspora mrakii TaxID=42260 RepID=A0A7H9B1S4_ZYGMR|nr:uncharacterized protein HG535_0D02990 [Zygotorulaspora mrakii]QLG72591.1 hypothetical protein HG535_0D02990 [Zygotorulaspora mrakii]
MTTVVATTGIVNNLHEICKVFAKYISDYIRFLNKFIGHLRKVATLRFERTTLIKYVKKLRFLHDTLTSYDVYSDINIDGETALANEILPMASFYLKIVELLDMLNFYLTQSLQKEIISKTLNNDLTLPEESISTIEDCYNHFVKFAEWMIESLDIGTPFLQIEVIQFAKKCAIEDNVDLESTNDIFLQEVAPVEDSEEYDNLSKEWSLLLEEKTLALDIHFVQILNHWSEKFDKKKDAK